MKAIVTGGAGFIGHNLCIKLQDLGWNVCVIDNYSTGYRINSVPGVEYCEGSVCEHKMRSRVNAMKPDVIFHMAAVPRVSFSVRFPQETSEVNVIGTVSVLNAVKDFSPKTRVILSSSSSVYGGADELPTPENYPSNPKSPYALQKWQSEQWAQMFAKMYGIDVCCLRYFNVMGPFARIGGAYSAVLSAWLYSIYIDRSIPTFIEGDGEQTRDFSYVDNVVQANIKAAQLTKQFTGEVFNIAQGEQYSLNQCKELIEAISGEALNLVRKPERIGDVRHSLADISAAKKVLGYNPEIDFKQQLTKMAEWYKTDYAKEVAAGKIQ